jgi:hypothetical protein
MSLVTLDSIKQKFKNLTNGTKYITSIINKQPKDIPFRDEEIELLLKQHPHEGKVKDIEYLVVKIRPPYNTKSLYIKNTTDNDEQDVSYKYSLKALYGKYSKETNKHDRTIRAFRDSIGNSKKRKFFFENNISINEDGDYIGLCENCKKTDKIHIDHYIVTFQQILDDFIQERQIDFSNLEVYEEDNLYYFNDNILMQDWINFHDGKVEYRVLCPPCNMSLGSYGYKKSISLYK